MFGRRKIESAGSSIIETSTKRNAATADAIPLDSFPIKDLLALKTRLDCIIAARRAEVQAQFTEQLELYGLSIDELKPVKKKRNTTVKFRDPDNPANVWSGIGKRKKWLQAYLDAGRSIEEFAVD
jgi:DNA-binding protein H-NS